MKIAIIGYSGSGKSTLARFLAQKYALPCLHLDTIHHLPGWKERSQEESQKIVKEFLDKHDGWVIDGNYSKLHYEERLTQADQIVLMLFNRIDCLIRVRRRYRQYRNAVRPDMAAGCNEKLDREFVRWILKDGRSASARKRYQRVMEQFPGKITVIKNQRQLDKFLQSIQQKELS